LGTIRCKQGNKMGSLPAKSLSNHIKGLGLNEQGMGLGFNKWVKTGGIVKGRECNKTGTRAAFWTFDSISDFCGGGEPGG